MTTLEINQLVKIAPEIKQSLEFLITDAIVKNDEIKPDDYSDELQLAIFCRDFLRLTVD